MSDKPALPDDLLAEIDRLAPQLTLLDHYGVLGVSETSSADEIKTAYLRTIKRFHPDRWHSRDSGVHRKRMEAIFSRATEAYEVLRRPETRLEYDRSLYEIRGIPRPSARPKDAPAPPPPPPPPRAAPAPAPPSPAPTTGVRKPPSSTQLAAAARMMSQLRPPTAAPPAAATAPRAPAAPQPAPVEAAKPSVPRPLILVVEDDDALRKMVARVLTELGEVREARDGLEALALIANDPLPHLVVTDVMMPNLDGLELARRLKADRRTARIPIVMLTAKQGPRDLIDGVNAGARIYVTKPFKVDELKAKAKKAMG